MGRRARIGGAVMAAGVLATCGSASAQYTTPAQVVPTSIPRGAVLVRVNINTYKAFMQVDTGATTSVIEARIAKEIHLPNAGKPVETSTIGCTAKAQPVGISKWLVGSAPMPDLTIASIRSPGKIPTYKGLPVIGLIKVGKRSAVFGVDTGAGATVVESSAAKRLKLPRITKKKLKVQTVACTTKVKPVLIRGWKSGKVRLPAELGLARNAGLKEIGLAGLIGAPVLSAFGQVTFDYTNKRVGLGFPIPEGAQPAPATRRISRQTPIN